MYFCHAYGISIRSCIPLPELTVCAEDAPDVVISCGRISDAPAELENVEHSAWAVSGGFCMYWRGLGTIAVMNGQEIVLESSP